MNPEITTNGDPYPMEPIESTDEDNPSSEPAPARFSLKGIKQNAAWR